ncbi:MAG TPA: DUF4179 domain-containing protein [Ruminiclostridium sp.]
MYENIEIPETIDEYISKGIKKGKKKKNSFKVKRMSGTIVGLALLLLITCIRVSPVFASNVAKIPGLKYIVELVRFDKGLSSAIDNNYIQNIDKSCEKLGIIFTVKDIIADTSGIIVFYSIENKGNYKWPNIREAKLLDSNGKQLEMSSSLSYTPSDDKIYKGKIDFYVVNENGENFQMPDNIVLQTKIAVNKAVSTENNDKPSNTNTLEAPFDDSEVLKGIWEVAIPIDKSKFSELEKVYKIDQSVEVEGQKILFEDIKIYPTKSILSVSFDKANSKKIFSLENLKLVDEKGQEWGRINNGMTGSFPGENSQTLNFQSNYFYKPKELYITGNSIRALEKGNCYITVDVEKRKITYSPYNFISISEFSLADNKLSFQAEIQKDLEDIYNGFQISNEATDANGNKLDNTCTGMVTDEKKIYNNYTLKLNDNFKGPITFKIYDYPSKIKGAFKVKIPLDR